MSENVIKIIALVLIGAILVVTIKFGRQEMGFLLNLGVSVVALTLIFEIFYPSAKTLINIYESSVGNKSSISVVIKAIIISYLSEFCGNICRDFGLSSLGEKAELAGKCAIFVLSIPLITSIIETAMDLTKI